MGLVKKRIKWFFTKEKDQQKFINIFFKADRYRFQVPDKANQPNRWIAKIEQCELEKVLYGTKKIVDYCILGNTIDGRGEKGILFKLELIKG